MVLEIRVCKNARAAEKKTAQKANERCSRRASFWPTPAASLVQPIAACVVTMSLVRLPAVDGMRGAVLLAELPCLSVPILAHRRSFRRWTIRYFDWRKDRVQAGKTPPPKQQSTNIQLIKVLLRYYLGMWSLPLQKGLQHILCFFAFLGFPNKLFHYQSIQK